MSNKKLVTNNDTFLKTQQGNLLSGNPNAVGKDLGEHKHYLMRNGKLLFNGGRPLAFSDTVSPVLNENSWATIRRVLYSGRMREFWNIGDYKICYRHRKNVDGTIASLEGVPFRLFFAGYSQSFDAQDNPVYRAIFCTGSDIEEHTQVVNFEAPMLDWMDVIELTDDDDYPYLTDTLFSYDGTRFRGYRKAKEVVGSVNPMITGETQPTYIRRFLNAEWEDISGMSIDRGDSIPARLRTVHCHSYNWDIPVSLYDKDFYMKDAIYSSAARLHLPSALEISHNPLHSESSIVYHKYLEGQAERERWGAHRMSDAQIDHLADGDFGMELFDTVQGAQLVGSNIPYATRTLGRDETMRHYACVVDNQGAHIEVLSNGLNNYYMRIMYTLVI